MLENAIIVLLLFFVIRVCLKIELIQKVASFGRTLWVYKILLLFHSVAIFIVVCMLYMSVLAQFFTIQCTRQTNWWKVKSFSKTSLKD